MKTIELLKIIVDKLITIIPKESIEIIIDNDIRVENYFIINLAIILEEIKKNKKIKSYEIQKTIKVRNKQRQHVDVWIEKSNGRFILLELKHFSISGNRNKKRNIEFYTSNSESGRKLGVIGDCIKLDNYKKSHKIYKDSELICLMIITHKPSDQEKSILSERLNNFKESRDWRLSFPIQKNINKNIDIAILVK